MEQITNATAHDDNSPSSLGARLRKARIDKGISLSELARQLGYAKSHLNGVETGRRRPSRELVDGYEIILGLEAGELSTPLANTPLSKPRKVARSISRSESQPIQEASDDLPRVQAPNIFVSHSRQDMEWCRVFTQELRRAGRNVWYDEETLTYGSFVDQVEHELQTRQIFIVVLSPSAVASAWVKNEIAAAVNLQMSQSKSKRIILPIMAERCRVPLMLASYQLFGNPTDGVLDPVEAARQINRVLLRQLRQSQPLDIASSPPTQAMEVPIADASLSAPSFRHWGEPIDSKRQAELDAMLRHWLMREGEREQGPFWGVRLSGADVFWLAPLMTIIDGSDGLSNDSVHSEGSNVPFSVLRFAKLNLAGANLNQAVLTGANLNQANLNSATLTGASLDGADLSGADLSGADLSGANLRRARLRNAILSGANLSRLNLSEADLSGADLRGANLSQTMLESAKLTRANLLDATVYECFSWNVQLDGTLQSALRINAPGEPTVTVDDLEVAQFLYVMLHNDKVRNLVDTLSSKVVLILGRFIPERKQVLDALHSELRRRGYSPVNFDLDRPGTAASTETIILLARMARFIIADLTDPSSIPHELQTLVPRVAVPVQPLIAETAKPFSMSVDYSTYHWVLPTYRYSRLEDLVATIQGHVIAPAEAKAAELQKVRQRADESGP